MINVDLSSATTVEEFYNNIRAGQEGEHGDDYCAQHDAMRKFFKEGGCTSYKELGTHQGGTAANAMLMGAKYIELVDIDMHRYRKFLKPLAERYCAEHKIELVVKEISSVGLQAQVMAPMVDMMLIDSIHKWHWTNQELDTHATNVRKFIAFHDTATCHDIRNGVDKWCQNNPWKLVDRGTTNVGYTVLQRTK